MSTAAPTYADGLREALGVVRGFVVVAGAGVVEAAAELERRVANAETTAVERGEEGSARAARRWTVEQSARVDQAIRIVATRLPDGFTTADVWAELGADFPVTKGIASKLAAAARAGTIVNTGRVTFNDHPRHDHAHGQRLALWRLGTLNSPDNTLETP